MQASSEIDMAVTKNSDFDDEKSTTKIYLVENLRKFAIGRNKTRKRDDCVPSEN